MTLVMIGTLGGPLNMPEGWYVQEDDPGAVGRKRGWIVPSTGATRVRNADNTGWIAVAAAAAPDWTDIQNIPATLAEHGIVDGASLDDLIAVETEIGPPFQALADGPTVTFDLGGAYHSHARVTIAGARTLEMLNPVAEGGSWGILRVTQGPGGGHTLALPGALGNGGVELSTAEGAVDTLIFVHDGTDYTWLKPGVMTGGFATEAYVDAAIAALVAAAPGALDTLDELAAALGDDANFASSVTTALAAKAPLASPALTGVPTVPTAAGGTSTTQAASTAFVQDAVAPAPTALASAAAIAHDCANKRTNPLTIDTLQHNATLTLSNLPDGATGDILVVQDATGGRTLALAHAGLTVKTKGAIAAAVGAISLVSFVRRGVRLLVTIAGDYA